MPAARPPVTGSPTASPAPGGRPSDWFERELVNALPELYAAARRMTRDAADAEDLVADAVARAWRKRDSLVDRAAFRGWMLRIVTNTFLSDCRARGSRPAHEPLVADAGPEDESFSLFERLHQPFLLWWGNPEQEFLNRLLRRDFENAVDALPEEFRVVVILVELQGLSYQEAADVLQVPVGTVRSRLARGRARLQSALWQHAVDAGLVEPRSSR